MSVSKAAKRYAIALLELSREKKLVEQTLEDMLFIQKTIGDSRDLQLFLKSPVIKPSVKKQTLAVLFEAHVQALSMQFVTLVAQKERADILPQITSSFILEYNKFAGIIEVEVRSARSLSAKQQKALQEVLEKTTSKKVTLHSVEQEELIGGLLVKIDDTVIDGTVKHKLEQLEESLLHQTVQRNIHD